MPVFSQYEKATTISKYYFIDTFMIINFLDVDPDLRTVSQSEKATTISKRYVIDIIFIIINLLDGDPGLPYCFST